MLCWEAAQFIKRAVVSGLLSLPAFRSLSALVYQPQIWQTVCQFDRLFVWVCMCRGDGGGGGFLSAHVGVRLEFKVVRGVHGGGGHEERHLRNMRHSVKELPQNLASLLNIFKFETNINSSA